MASRTASNIENVLKLLRRCEALEEEYVAWFSLISDAYGFKPVAFIDSIQGDISESVVHPGRIDSYDEIGVASTCNLARSCRLFIWSTLLRCIAWLGEPQDYRLSPEFTVASRVCTEIIEDIIASLPYHFGWNDNGAVAMSSTGNNYAVGCDQQTSITGVIATFVIWPTFTALTSDFATESQKLYLTGRLRAINEATGMNQASVLIERVSYLQFHVNLRPRLIVHQAALSHPSAYIQRERVNHNASSPRNSPPMPVTTELSSVLSKPAPPPSRGKEKFKSVAVIPISPPRSVSPTGTFSIQHLRSSFNGEAEEVVDPSWRWTQNWDQLTNSFILPIEEKDVKAEFFDDIIQSYHYDYPSPSFLKV